MTKAKRKAPSRVRYEQANPTISCRVPREVRNRLEAVKEAKGMSFTDILKVGLGILEARARSEAELTRQGHAAGYKKGYAEAERLYKVTYPCKLCGKPLAVTSEDEKRAIRGYMQKEGWAHGKCYEGRR